MRVLAKRLWMGTVISTATPKLVDVCMVSQLLRMLLHSSFGGHVQDFLQGIDLGVEMLGHEVCTCSDLQKKPQLSKMAKQFLCLLTKYESSLCVIPSPDFKMSVC